MNIRRDHEDAKKATKNISWSRAAPLLALAALAFTGCSREASPPQRQTPAIAAAPPAPARPAAEALALPRKPGSVRFAAIGDSGRGDPPQYEVSAQMQVFRKVFSYEFVVMLGDNVYDGGTPEYYRDRFELPYKPLLDAGVKFYATLGNHDDPNQPFYAPFNMGGERYYTFKPPSLVARLAGTGDDVRFFMIDTERLDRLAARMDRSRDGTLGIRVEDPDLPSTDLHLGALRAPGARLPRGARAAVPEARRQGGVLRT